MQRRILFSVLALALVVGVGRPASAQATLTQTTLSAALNNTATSFNVASASGAAAGYIVYVDREAMRVNSVSSNTLTVQRGVNGTSAQAHAASAVAFLDQAQYFYNTDMSGTCTATNQVVLPHINVTSGQIAQCVNGRWQGQAGSYLPFTGAVYPRTPVVNVAYTAKYTDVIIAYTSLSAARSVTLPSAVGMAGKVFIIKDEDGLAATYNITVVGTIDGSSNATISSNYGVGRYFSDGTAWFSW